MLRCRPLTLLLSTAFLAASGCFSGAPARAGSSAPSSGFVSEIDALYPDIEALYIDLHRSPELANGEERTAAQLARRLRPLGYEVASGVGGHGILAALRNG